MAYIEIKDLSKWYPQQQKDIRQMLQGEKLWVKALDGVNLEIEKGEILGLIGESGCGKSTFGRLVSRLEEPSRGDVFIDGVSTNDIVKKDNKAFRRLVQIVFQNPFDTFTPRDTMRKILMRPIKHHNLAASEAEALKMIHEALERGGLYPVEDILDRYPHQLSGGQLQRLSIIRAMFLDPSVIVADEPVSMLDVSVRADIINLLQNLAQEKDATVIFISHDIALTRYISDTIAVMYLGRIVEYGKTEELIHNPQHPYTRALISNCADIDPRVEIAAISIAGEPPTPINPGPGCYFAPRCQYAEEECFKSYPGPVWMSQSHYACCFKVQASGFVDKFKEE